MARAQVNQKQKKAQPKKQQVSKKEQQNPKKKQPVKPKREVSKKELMFYRIGMIVVFITVSSLI